MRVTPIAIVMLAVLLAGCAPTERATRGAEAAPAPDFEVRTFEGESFRLREHEGTPVVLNFWESW